MSTGRSSLFSVMVPGYGHSVMALENMKSFEQAFTEDLAIIIIGKFMDKICMRTLWSPGLEGSFWR